jgi:hypothetical protein
MVLLFNPEGRGTVLCETVVDFHRTVQHYIPEDRTAHRHCCENLSSKLTSSSLVIIVPQFCLVIVLVEVRITGVEKFVLFLKTSAYSTVSSTC